ncbi:hypothetical protein QYF36_006462 [Acer negundo]|nr:hypothetical protein QYF36_006462 [Acer negundo]
MVGEFERGNNTEVSISTIHWNIKKRFRRIQVRGFQVLTSTDSVSVFREFEPRYYDLSFMVVLKGVEWYIYVGLVEAEFARIFSISIATFIVSQQQSRACNGRNRSEPQM